MQRNTLLREKNMSVVITRIPLSCLNIIQEWVIETGKTPSQVVRESISRNRYSAKKR